MFLEDEVDELVVLMTVGCGDVDGGERINSDVPVNNVLIFYVEAFQTHHCVVVLYDSQRICHAYGSSIRCAKGVYCNLPRESCYLSYVYG